MANWRLINGEWVNVPDWALKWLPTIYAQAAETIQEAIYDELLWWTPRDVGDAMSEVMFKRLSERAS